MHHLSRFSLIAVLTCFWLGQLSALTFQSLFSRLEPSGKGSSVNFAVTNESSKSSAVIFTIASRNTGANGEELNADAGSLFTISPDRVLLEPHSSQLIKLQWIGPVNLDSELAFRLIAQNNDGRSGPPLKSGIPTTAWYIAFFYVGEPSFAPLLVPTVRGALNDQGTIGYQVEITNRGNAHVVASAARLKVTTAKGKSRYLTAAALGPLARANLLPGYPIAVFIPDAEAVVGWAYNAEFAYTPGW